MVPKAEDKAVQESNLFELFYLVAVVQVLVGILDKWRTMTIGSLSADDDASQAINGIIMKTAFGTQSSPARDVVPSVPKRALYSSLISIFLESR